MHFGMIQAVCDRSTFKLFRFLKSSLSYGKFQKGSANKKIKISISICHRRFCGGVIYQHSLNYSLYSSKKNIAPREFRWMIALLQIGHKELINPELFLTTTHSGINNNKWKTSNMFNITWKVSLIWKFL